ncbi:diguanylate cyclase [Ferrigenium kumadai]|uniref:diguanylate cyclase n=1 Tax=Ferrigenium kumadai TaxID=1682490 RepID=A0AAN1W0U3_9PROT|nr:GGDEF domain-containing protein [Ferrigenium kumadai]BBI99722.1 diguanylate cyclase [Ferrigenium kumadai]
MNHSPEILTLLTTSPLFRGVPRNFLIKTLSQSKLLSLKKGDTLLTPGQLNDQIYIILFGRLSVQMKEFRGEPIAMFGEGECVGEMSVLGDGYVSAYVIAATDCRLIAIDQAALWALIDNSSEASRNMLSILSHRIRVGDQRMAESLEREQGYVGSDTVDELTGLYSQQWSHDKLGRYLQRRIADQKLSCMLMLEMDGFQDFCDKFGTLGGDQALRTIAQTILSSLRPDDQAGRYRGPQFSVFLPNATSLANACTAAERLRAAVNQAAVVLPSGDALPPVSISIGVVQMHMDDNLDSLFARAEGALHIAQESGGNSVKCEE